MPRLPDIICKFRALWKNSNSNYFITVWSNLHRKTVTADIGKQL